MHVPRLPHVNKNPYKKLGDGLGTRLHAGSTSVCTIRSYGELHTPARK